ncbi:Transglycosylase SLT domain-containing protein [Nannocystis exedens]|uniref:Transglycosylase SLT domain-containing protein n=1 Tax=Nannocystis exedens TaxID=54 RepID=A0A1I2H7X2_9BACT|nr:lytic transglycosylase domain-containing protein [Nannocystis exedens]PCC75809.1 transglycosylase SLT domain protein [Nannocystis exedens]SFF25678.1 Transglycosylase SLT domain-containing protein [Nannocystis exedens]
MSRRLAWRAPGARAAVLAAILIALPGGPAGAAEPTYRRYTDAQGVVHVTPVRAVGAGRREVEEMPGSGGEGGAPKTAASEAEPSAPRRDPQVEVAEALADERSRRWETHIRGAARLYQLPESLVRAVIHTESNYYPGAVSSTGAMGLMQLMPSTARFLGVQQPFDPRQSIYGGAKFLRLLANRFGGDMVLVAAGYFSGAGAVQKYGGVPPHAGVRAYVKAVLRRFYAYERLLQDGAGGASPARAIAGP